MVAVLQVLAVATFARDPFAVAAMELLRMHAMPEKDFIKGSGDLDLPKLLAERSP
jgi:hypothetical protein